MKFRGVDSLILWRISPLLRTTFDPRFGPLDESGYSSNQGYRVLIGAQYCRGEPANCRVMWEPAQHSAANAARDRADIWNIYDFVDNWQLRFRI